MIQEATWLSSIYHSTLCLRDMVWLLRRHISTTHPCAKLDHKKLRPFCVVEYINLVAFRLAKLHPTSGFTMFSCLPPWSPLCFITPKTPCPTTTTSAVDDWEGIRGRPNTCLAFAWSTLVIPSLVDHKSMTGLGKRRKRGNSHSIPEPLTYNTSNI